MSERLPGPAWSIHTVKATGNLIEEELCLFAATIQNTLEINLVAGVVSKLLCAAHGALNDRSRCTCRVGIESVERAFAIAPGFHHLAIGEQAQMCGDTRLAHPRDLL